MRAERVRLLNVVCVCVLRVLRVLRVRYERVKEHPCGRSLRPGVGLPACVVFCDPTNQPTHVLVACITALHLHAVVLLGGWLVACLQHPLHGRLVVDGVLPCHVANYERGHQYTAGDVPETVSWVVRFCASSCLCGQPAAYTSTIYPVHWWFGSVDECKCVYRLDPRRTAPHLIDMVGTPHSYMVTWVLHNGYLVFLVFFLPILWLIQCIRGSPRSTFNFKDFLWATLFNLLLIISDYMWVLALANPAVLPALTSVRTVRTVAVGIMYACMRRVGCACVRVLSVCVLVRAACHGEI